MKKRKLKLYIAAGLSVLMNAVLTACGDAVVEGTPVARVGDSILTLEKVAAGIPRGLSPEDSSRFSKAFIENWIDTRLIHSMARDEIDMKEIDRLTKEYRDELIVNAYRRRMVENEGSPVLPQDSVVAFYNAHKDEFKLTRPLVRGIYLKIAERAPELATLRKLYRSTDDESMDRLEKVAFNSAVHYDAFRDRWVDWEQIELHVPYDFGPRPELFPAKGRLLDFTSGEWTYLLNITDCLPAGAQMPMEFAEPIIRERLLIELRRRLDLEMMQDIRKRAADEGLLERF